MARFDVGDVLSRTFRTVFENFPVYLKTQGVFLLIVGAISLVEALWFTAAGMGQLFDPDRFANPMDLLRFVGPLTGIGFLLGIVNFILTTLGALVGTLVAANLLSGEPLDLTAAWERAKPRAGNYVLTLLLMFLAFMGIMFAGAILFILVVPFFIAIGVVVWLALRWTVALPVSALEASEPTENLRRSTRLTEGSKGGILGVFIVLFLVQFAGGMVITAITGGFAFMQGGFPDPGDPFTPPPGLGPQAHLMTATNSILTTALSLVMQPLFVTAAVLVYRELTRPPPEGGPITTGETPPDGGSISQP